MRTIERRRGRRLAAVVLAGALVAAACSEPEEEGTSAATDPAPTEAPATDPPADEPEVSDTDASDTQVSDTAVPTDPPATDPHATDPPVESDGSVVSAHAGETWFLGEVPASATPADESLEPIRLGMINQEDTPLGSFPEVRAAAEAAATWVNAELGGVDMRPVEIVTCVTSFDVEQSQSCAIELEQAGVVALVGGVDVTSNGSYPVIEQNGLAVVGGIPANLVEQRSPNAFFFSGGGAGGAAAFMAHAAENGAETVLLAYGEFESFEVAAQDYAAAVGESLGMNVELVPFSLFATDYLPVLTKAQDVGADAIIVLAADAACAPLMQTAVDLELDAQLYLFGSCAAESIVDAAGEDAIGVIFNSEGPVSPEDAEGAIFQDVIDRYATEPANAAGTVGFRGFMNLYAMLLQLGGDAISSEGVIDVARSAVDEPSFWGHPYTCDGQQVPGLPALCAPQQILFAVPAVGEDLIAVSDWIPVDELFAAALGVTDHLTFLLLGLGAGAVIAALAIGIVVTYRASNVVNFAHAATGTFIALAYYELRASGDLVLPILGLPDRVHLVDRPTTATALIIIVVYAALIGAALYWMVFRFLREAPPLAGLVASLGLLLYFITLSGLRFERSGAAAFLIEGPLPDDLVTFGGAVAPVDRYLLAGIVVVVAVALSLVYRYTRFGLATRAVAENHVAASLLGISPNPIGTINWALATVLAGGALILAAPIIRLDPATSSLLIVPALAAALPGRFDSVGLAAVFGLLLGMLQSEILNLQADWDWLPDIGLQQGIPFVLILITLLVRGDSVPGRSDTTALDLPNAPDHRWAVPTVLAVTAIAAVGLLVLDSQWRLGIIVSAITAVIALSVVLLTGYVGQVSLATYALAGVAAFAMVRLSDDLGVPFPFAPLLGAAVAVATSIVVGFAAVRTRGMTLAIATLAAAVAIEELLFRWDWFTGGLEGATVDPPSVFGIDLRISAPGDAFPRQQFGVLVLFVLAISTIAVVMVRRSGTGRRWLAVRSNERAAASAGVPVARVKLEAFAIAGFVAGIGGTLLAYRRELVTTSSFGVLDSVVVLAITYLAGVATPLGALLAGVLAAGGLLTVALEELSPGSTDAQLAVNGILLVVVAIRFPSGILGARRRNSRPRRTDVTLVPDE